MKKILSLIFAIMLVGASPVMAQQFGTGPFGGGGVISNGDITLQNGELISNSTDGIICLAGGGGTNNEDICFDFEIIADRVVFSTNTGASLLDFSGHNFLHRDDLGVFFGGSQDSFIVWETTGNDNLQIGTVVGSADSSGYVSLMEKADLGTANRSPSGTSPDLVLRVYSSDATVATDYIEMSHNQTNGVIATGVGQIIIDSADAIQLDSNIGVVFFMRSATNGGSIKVDLSFDQLIFGVEDNTGNQLIISNHDNRDIDHDHTAPTDPTLFIHSDTNPDLNNTQWGSLSHDKSDFIIEGGSSGAVVIKDDTGELAKIVRGGVIPFKTTSDPCSSSIEGAIFYNSTANELCFCDGSNDLRVKDATTACF